MTFKNIPSGQVMVQKTKGAARYVRDDTADLAKAIAHLIVTHPKKCIAFLVLEGWIHSLVAHHINEAKSLMEVLNPF